MKNGAKGLKKTLNYTMSSHTTIHLGHIGKKDKKNSFSKIPLPKQWQLENSEADFKCSLSHNRGMLSCIMSWKTFQKNTGLRCP